MVDKSRTSPAKTAWIKSSQAKKQPSNNYKNTAKAKTSPKVEKERGLGLGRGEGTYNFNIMETAIQIKCTQSDLQIAIHISVSENTVNTEPTIEVIDNVRPVDSIAKSTQSSKSGKVQPIKQSKWNEQYNYFPRTKAELEQIIKNRMDIEGFECDLNDVDVSQISDMSYIFSHFQFNGDISKWVLHKGVSMIMIFYNSPL